MSSTETTRRASGYSVRDVFGVLADRQTYNNLLYLMLAFPLGSVYSAGLMLGLLFGTIFSIFLVGIGILLGTVLGGRFLARFERRLANDLLGLEIRSADDIDLSPEDGLYVTLRAYLEAPSTWRRLGFLGMKFWVGLLGFVLVFLFLSTLLLLTAPLHYPYEAVLITINSEPIVWTIETLPEAILAVLVGIFLAIVSLHATNAFATLCGWMAIALLGETDKSREGAAETVDGSRTEMLDESTPEHRTDRLGPGNTE